MATGDRSQAQSQHLFSARSSKICPLPLSPEAGVQDGRPFTLLFILLSGMSRKSWRLLQPPVLESIMGYLPVKSDPSQIFSYQRWRFLPVFCKSFSQQQHGHQSCVCARTSVFKGGSSNFGQPYQFRVSCSIHTLTDNLSCGTQLLVTHSKAVCLSWCPSIPYLLSGCFLVRCRL